MGCLYLIKDVERPGHSHHFFDAVLYLQSVLALTLVSFSHTHLHHLSFPLFLKFCAFEWLQSSISW